MTFVQFIIDSGASLSIISSADRCFPGSIIKLARAVGIKMGHGLLIATHAGALIVNMPVDRDDLYKGVYTLMVFVLIVKFSDPNMTLLSTGTLQRLGINFFVKGVEKIGQVKLDPPMLSCEDCIVSLSNKSVPILNGVSEVDVVNLMLPCFDMFTGMMLYLPDLGDKFALTMPGMPAYREVAA